MSAIGGIWQSDGCGGDALRERVEILYAALGRRGPDGGGLLLSGPAGPVGMCHRAFHTNAESRRDRQPRATADGLMVACDGRLDNREDLARTLGLDHGRAATDSEIATAAFGRWRGSCPEHLIGDYALAVWDARGQELLLARDPGGTRPLFYHEGRGLLAWASSLEALLAAAGLARDLDPRWIGGFLTDCYPVGHTPYRAIHCLPPGHALAAGRGGTRVRAFWRPEPGAAGRRAARGTSGAAPAADAETEERFAATLGEAVRCRLRADRPVGAELSGGFDSSSIVCLAADLLAAGRAAAPRLLTLSYVFDDSPTCDERRFIRAVERRIGQPGHHIVQERFRMFDGLDEPWTEIPNLLLCTKAREQEAIRTLRQAGGSVLLCGMGGDDLLWSEVDQPPELADHLWAGRWRRLPRDLRRWSALQGRPLPLLLLRAAFRVLAKPPHRPAPAWIHLEFARSLGLPWRRRPGEPRPAASTSPSQREHAAGVASAIDRASWMYDRGPQAVEMSFPFLDRRLIELCLSLPVSDFVRGAETRSLHRRALRHLLPPEVAARRGKIALSEALLRDFALAWPRLREIFPRPLCCQLGFVEERALLRAMHGARAGLGHGAVNLLFAVGLEFWLRGLERAPASALPEAERRAARAASIAGIAGIAGVAGSGAAGAAATAAAMAGWPGSDAG